MELIEVKQCKSCGKHKPIETYDWSDRKKGYKKSYCRECCIKINMDWKTLNKEGKWREWFDKYYSENPDKYGLTGNPKGRPIMKTENEYKSGVYIITNTITNETYVGCSKDVKRRLWRHLDYNRGRSKQKLLSKALKTYGREAFKGEVLEYCHPSKIFEREAVYMESYGCEYNMNKVKK